MTHTATFTAGVTCDAVLSEDRVTGRVERCSNPATWRLGPQGWAWCDDHMDRLAEEGDSLDGYERI